MSTFTIARLVPRMLGLNGSSHNASIWRAISNTVVTPSRSSMLTPPEDAPGPGRRGVCGQRLCFESSPGGDQHYFPCQRNQSVEVGGGAGDGGGHRVGPPGTHRDHPGG